MFAGKCRGGRVRVKALGLAIAAFTGACAAPSVGVSEATRVDEVLRNGSAGYGLAAIAEPAEARIGQDLRLRVSAAKGGFLYVFQTVKQGSGLAMIFPNSVDGANQVAAGAIELPRDTWTMRAMGPEGAGYFVVVMADQPQDLIQLAEKVKAGTSPLIQGPYGSAVTSYRELP